MTLQDYRRANGVPLFALPEQLKKEQLDALKYIESLSTSTATDITSWNLTVTFGSGTDNVDPPITLLTTDRSEINRRFFQKRESEVISQSTLSEAEARVIELAQRNYWKTSTDQIDENIKAAVNRYASAVRHADDLAYQLRCLREERLLIQHKPQVDLLKEITNTISASRFYRFLGIKRSKAYFLTQPITLREHIPAADIDYGIKMAPLFVEFDLTTGFIKVLLESAAPYEFTDSFHKDREFDKLSYCWAGHYFHPHVSDTGHVCWGTAAHKAEEILKTGKVSELLELLRLVLTNYNAANPFVSLGEFYQNAQTSQRFGEYKPYQPEPEENDEEEEEEYFDEDEGDRDDI